jgi:hypothetical protein
LIFNSLTIVFLQDRRLNVKAIIRDDDIRVFGLIIITDYYWQFRKYYLW